MQTILFLIGYLFVIVISYVVYGVFLMRFPHEKFWVTRELDFDYLAKKFKENAGERVTVFVALMAWPITIVLFAVIRFFIILSIGADCLLESLLSKMKRR